MNNALIQAGIIVLSGGAIWLVSRRESWHRWGYVVGLAAQPLWIYTSLANRQWGVFGLSLWYTYCWAQGIWNYWVRR